MKNNLVKSIDRSLFIVFIILIVLMGGAWLMRGQILWWLSGGLNEDEYVINHTVPTGMKYTDGAMPEEKPEVDTGDSINNGSNFATDLAILNFVKKDIKVECLNGSEQGEYIPYFSSSPGDTEVMLGGVARGAVRCGNEYVVLDYRDDRGYVWAGPYTIL